MGTVGNRKVIPMEVTWAGSAMGFTEGDLAWTIEEQTVDVTAHQEGTNVLSAIRTGKSAELSVTVGEVNKGMVEYLLQQGGAQATASGAASATVGWGNSKDFTQVTTQAGKLTLHPVTKAAADKTEDLSAWKAYPMVNSINYSGENMATLDVTFMVFPDTAKADKFRLFVFGDSDDGDFSATE